MTFVFRATALVLFAGLLVACESPAPQTTAEQRQAALQLIGEAGISAHVEYLADDARRGRKSGEAGYDEAAAYVAEQFSAIGLVPAGVGGWYQPVTLRQFKIDTEAAQMCIHRDGKDALLTYRDDFAMSGDVVRAESAVRARVAYVGYGVHAPEYGYSDYDGIDVRGKIVAYFRGAPDVITGDAAAHFSSGRTKALEAVARGAVGVLVLRTRKTEERRPWEEQKQRFGKRPGMAWVTSDGRAARYYPEIQVSGWLSMAASEQLFGLAPLSFEAALEASLGDSPHSTILAAEVSMSNKTTHTTTGSPNVIGMVRGTDPDLADEYLVYSAHLDHIGVIADEAKDDVIYNGMYDNAMGVALMIETARAIAAAPPRRSVLFIALAAEESGLIGSDYFVNNPTVPVDAIVANINLDMPLFLQDVADLIAFGSQHSSMQAVVEAAAAAEGFVFSPDPMPEERLFVRSDQYSFVLKGVPSVYLVTGFNAVDPDVDGEALFRDHLENHYHEPSDDMTLPVHWASAVRFARAHTRIGQTIANDPERPQWNEGDFFGALSGNK